MRRLAAIAALLLAPALASAQPYFPRTPVAFTGPTRTYTLYGCGDAALSGLTPAPDVRAFCLDGTATVGVATSASGYRYLQTVLDLTGTRLSGFAGRFYDFDFSDIQIPTTYRRVDGTSFSVQEGFAPAIDPTGHTTFGYVPLYLVDGAGNFNIAPDGVTFGSSADVYLAYTPQDVPPNQAIYGRGLLFSLAVTETPEPATLALTLGGLAVLGAGAWRRRRAA